MSPSDPADTQPAGTPAADEPAGARLMDIGEFRRLGYLQELNRQFLHPLGLAMAISVDSDGNERLSGVWDDRNDPEGIRYAPGVIDPEKTARVLDAQRRMGDSRLAVLGYVMQSVDQAGTLEPSTPPAQPAHTARAAAGPPPGTLDGPGVLGRALLSRLRRRVWLATGAPDEWALGAEQGWWTRAAIEEDAGGPVREVLLVDPAAGRVLDAALRWHEARGQSLAAQLANPPARPPSYGYAADALADAVDALDRPTVARQTADQPEPAPTDAAATEPSKSAEPAPEPAGDADDCLRTAAEVRARSAVFACDWCGYPASAHPGDAPEPAGDGPGWNRTDIEAVAVWLESAPDHPEPGPELAASLRALLADRDRWAKVSGKWADETIAARNAADAARAELAEVRSELRAERATLVLLRDNLAAARAELARHQDAYRQVIAVLGSHDPTRQIGQQITELLATARRDAAADTLDDAARRIRRIWTSIVAPERVASYFDAMARGTRTGTRPVPGSPEGERS